MINFEALEAMIKSVEMEMEMEVSSDPSKTALEYEGMLKVHSQQLTDYLKRMISILNKIDPKYYLEITLSKGPYAIPGIGIIGKRNFAKVIEIEEGDEESYKRLGKILLRGKGDVISLGNCKYGLTSEEDASLFETKS